jgi:hypothetical protein
VENNGFETVAAWRLPVTEFSADYSQAQAHSGLWSMRTGITNPADNVFSFSTALQTVSIPADATAANLRFFLFPQTSENPALAIPASLREATTADAGAVGDAQWMLILDTLGNELARPVSMRSNAQAWSEYTVDLLPYAGRTIQIYFGTFNNGWDGITAMFVDDVTLELCTGGEPPVLTYRFNLPTMFNDVPLGISGRVVDGLGLPLAQVPLSTGGLSTGTDADGRYNFRDLGPGAYTVAPQLTGYVCAPAARTVAVPPSAGEQDFVCSVVAYP